MHRALLGRSQPEICGAWRSKAVWVRGHSPHTAEYVGPESARINELIADLEIFMQRTDLPVLAQVALAHAQFETIHPFEDGNGRTGRALVQSLLRHTGIAANTAIPISAGLLHDTQHYFSALSAYRRGEIVPIIRTFTEATFRAISNGRALVKNLQNITDDWATAHKFRAKSAASKIQSILIEQPVVSIPLLRERFGLSAPALAAGVSQLVEAGFLKPLNANKRNRIWLAEEVLVALDEFAARSRRR
jgi:Fic family protein